MVRDADKASDSRHKVCLRDVVLPTAQRDPRLRPDEWFEYIDVSSIDRESLSIRQTATTLGRDAPSRARKIVRSGDVIFATVRPRLRRVAIVPPELDDQVCSTAFCVVRADARLADPTFVYFAVAHHEFVEHVAEHEHGSSYPAVTDSQVLGEWIPFPPLPEQRAIAAVLRTVQRAREACEGVIAATRQLKASLLEYLFTYGPVPFDQADQVELKETEAGGCPAEWSLTAISDIAIVKYGKARPKTDGIVPVVGSGGVFAFASHPLVHPPTIVIGRKGAAGKVWLLDGASWPSDTTFFLQWSGKPTEPRFVFHALQRRPISGEHAKTTLPSVQKADVENYRFCAGSVTEQSRIADTLAVVDAKLDAEERRRAALEALFQSLLHHLMTGKVRVKPQVEPQMNTDTHR